MPRIIKNGLVYADGGSHTYSTTEQVVGTWVDGSPVYEKTIYNAGGVTGNISIPHGITGMNRVLDYTVSVMDAQYSQYHQFFTVPRIDNANISVDYMTDTNIFIKVSNLYESRLSDWYITIRYTKSSS